MQKYENLIVFFGILKIMLYFCASVEQKCRDCLSFFYEVLVVYESLMALYIN